MKLDLNFVLKGLDGQPMQGPFEATHAGAIVAQALAYNNAQIDIAALKRFILAQELYKKMPVEVDSADLKGIKNLISQQNGFPPVTISQVHEVIDKLLE